MNALNRVSRGYNQRIQTYISSIDENLKDRDADCLSLLHAVYGLCAD